MKIAVPAETFPGERRVAIVPASLKPLSKLGAEVLVERGAGVKAGFTDDDYTAAGARIIDDRGELLESADLIVQVRAATANPEAGQADLARLKAGQCLIAQCDPLSDAGAMVKLAGTGAAIISLELVPRITRAQSIDVLSSMATLAGYKAVLIAANHAPQMFPMMMTAAGTLAPAKVLVLGVGVAGMQAIASAKRLGAVVHAYDLRPETKEQVESLGGKFVVLDIESGTGEGGYARAMGEEFYRKQRELMTEVVRDFDVVITTAAVPGKKAPTLLTKEMVAAMPAGSVVVYLAAERGGNCELTRPGETCVVDGVTIIGPMNVPSDLPKHASQMFSNNVTTFLKLLLNDGKIIFNMQDEVIAGMLVAKDGEVLHPFVRELAGLPKIAPVAAPQPAPAAVPEPTPPRETIPLAGDEPESPPAESP
ncbi:MAG: Re/Si-specific NAD(P)(+) transhydrogenase subunit alpha [Planctomycetaceae bacterium]